MNTKPIHVRAAGGIVWRPNAQGSAEVVGIYRPALDNWSLPKGKLEPGEHPLVGACREVQEETGIDPIPQSFLTTASYQLSRPGGDVTKTVSYWSMRSEDPYATFTPNDEVSERVWFPLAEAFEVLTRPRDQQALKVFADLPTVTSTIVLMRHASADTGVDDQTRQLDADGLVQATNIVPLVACYQPRRLVSATISRCQQTMAPLADALDVSVVTDSVFDLSSHEINHKQAVTALRSLASTGGGVVCSQEPVIVDSLALMADIDGVKLLDVRTPVGSAWVLSFAGDTCVSVERL